MCTKLHTCATSERSGLTRILVQEETRGDGRVVLIVVVVVLMVVVVVVVLLVVVAVVAVVAMRPRPPCCQRQYSGSGG